MQCRPWCVKPHALLGSNTLQRFSRPQALACCLCSGAPATRVLPICLLGDTEVHFQIFWAAVDLPWVLFT